MSGLGLDLSVGLRGGSSPAGPVYIVDTDGAFLLDTDGAYIVDSH